MNVAGIILLGGSSVLAAILMIVGSVIAYGKNEDKFNIVVMCLGILNFFFSVNAVCMLLGM